MVDQNEMRRKALMDQMGGGNTGFGGTPNVSALAPPPAATAAPLPASPVADIPAPAAAPALDFSRMTGYDQHKFESNKQDAKYQMGRTLAGFDPRQGFTPDVVNALNGLGYGTFSGSGDKLSLSGLTDKGRANNLTGDYKDADFVQGLHGGNGKWAYADPAAEAAQAATAQPQGGMALPNLGGGDAQSNIAAQLAAMTQQSPNLAALIAQLGGQQ